MEHRSECLSVRFISLRKELWTLKRSRVVFACAGTCKCLTAESVEGAALTFQSVDNVHGSDGLPLGVFGVGDGIPDDVLKEHLEYATAKYYRWWVVTPLRHVSRRDGMRSDKVMLIPDIREWRH